MMKKIMMLLLIVSSLSYSTEKFVYVGNPENHPNEVSKTVQEWLDKGWRVKLISTISGDYTNARMFVVFTDQEGGGGVNDKRRSDSKK